MRDERKRGFARPGSEVQPSDLPSPRWSEARVSMKLLVGLVLLSTASGCFVSMQAGPVYHHGTAAEFGGAGFGVVALGGVEVNIDSRLEWRGRARKGTTRAAVGFGFLVDNQPVRTAPGGAGGSMGFSAAVLQADVARTVLRRRFDHDHSALLVRFGGGAAWGFAGSASYFSDDAISLVSEDLARVWALHTGLEVGVDGLSASAGLFLGGGFRLASFETDTSFGDASAASPYVSLTAYFHLLPYFRQLLR